MSCVTKTNCFTLTVLHLENNVILILPVLLEGILPHQHMICLGKSQSLLNDWPLAASDLITFTQKALRETSLCGCQSAIQMTCPISNLILH